MTTVEAPIVRRCHDAVSIQRILRKYAFDAPIPYFPRSFFRTAVRQLLASSKDVYFVTAESRGEFLGFALAHTLGPTMWRKFARAQINRHPIAICWLVFRLKLVMPIQRRLNAFRNKNENHCNRIPPLDIRNLNQPFIWSDERPDIGQVDQLFVCDTARGSGIATALLQFLAKEMCGNSVTLIEAHVDETNYASLRAFLKAGWSAFQTTNRDYYVCYRRGEGAQVENGQCLSAVR